MELNCCCNVLDTLHFGPPIATNVLFDSVVVDPKNNKIYCLEGSAKTTRSLKVYSVEEKTLSVKAEKDIKLAGWNCKAQLVFAQDSLYAFMQDTSGANKSIKILDKSTAETTVTVETKSIPSEDKTSWILCGNKDYLAVLVEKDTKLASIHLFKDKKLAKSHKLTDGPKVHDCRNAVLTSNNYIILRSEDKRLAVVKLNGSEKTLIDLEAESSVFGLVWVEQSNCWGCLVTADHAAKACLLFEMDLSSTSSVSRMKPLLSVTVTPLKKCMVWHSSSKYLILEGYDDVTKSHKLKVGILR